MKKSKNCSLAPTCLDCTERLYCGTGIASKCDRFNYDTSSISLPCHTCSRTATCPTLRAVRACKKAEGIHPLMMAASAPNLKTYALRMEEYMPFEAEWVTLDNKAIRLFLGEPKYNGNIWTIDEKDGREVATIRHDGCILNGIVDLTEFLDYEDSPIRFNRVKLAL